MGYTKAAKSLEMESNIKLYSDKYSQFIELVL